MAAQGGMLSIFDDWPAACEMLWRTFMKTKTTTLDRRALLRTLVVSIGAMALGRVVAACSDPAPTPNRLTGTGTGTGSSPPPNDQNEHVPGTSTPVDTGSDIPKVPNQVWEARVKQLEAEQLRLYGRGEFLRGDAGVMSGKENSHEPKASIVQVNGSPRVQVTVEHVMGKSGLDAGTPADSGADTGAKDASADADAGALDAGDAGDAGDGGIKVDAGTPQVHYITTVYLRALVNGVDTVVGLWEFVSTDPAPPTVQFTLPLGVTAVTAYEWCTLHGLWKAPPLATV
jgi:hypothetical protein